MEIFNKTNIFGEHPEFLIRLSDLQLGQLTEHR